MNLKELLSVLEVVGNINVEENKEIEIANVAYHSGKVAAGDLFVAIKGYETDGHLYIESAVKNGAVAAIVEEFNEDVKIPQYKVSDSRLSLAILGDMFYNHPSKKMKMVGITATNGKTTTAYMTNKIFEVNNHKTGMVGTVVVKMDDEEIASDLTTPESLDLQGYLGRMVEKGVTHVTMEASSAALELNRVAMVDYDIVVLNNVARDHIDLHGSFEKYFEAKSKLILEAKESAYAVLNIDCPHCASLKDKAKATVVTYGLENDDAHVSVRNLDLTTGRAKFDVVIQKPFTVEGYTYEEQTFRVALGVPGFHSMYNSMAAIIIALLNRIDIKVINKALMEFEGVERRFEFIFEEEFKIVDDHFANSGNIDVTFETMKYMNYDKLHLVYAIRGSRGVTVNRENAESIVKWSKILGFDEIIATKSKSLMTKKDIVLSEEETVLFDVLGEAGIKINLFDELDDAIYSALKGAKENDVILLAGCQGMDYGAQIALNRIQEMKPEIPREELFKPLEKRVAGI